MKKEIGYGGNETGCVYTQLMALSGATVSYGKVFWALSVFV